MKLQLADLCSVFGSGLIDQLRTQFRPLQATPIFHDFLASETARQRAAHAHVIDPIGCLAAEKWRQQEREETAR